LGVKLFENFGWIVIWCLEDAAHVRVQMDLLSQLLVYFKLVHSAIVI